MLSEIKSNEYAEYVNVETGKNLASIQQMIEEATILGCDGVVNCTGMGSKTLCDDKFLIGARGVLLHFDRSSCIWRDALTVDAKNVDSTVIRGGNSLTESVIMVEEPPFGNETKPCYMIPRGNIIVVGGTYLEGDEEDIIRPQERKRMIDNARAMGIDTNKSMPIGDWVGFRPVRTSARLEVDERVGQSEGVKVVHNFGFGGSGWTVFIGAAREAASLFSPILT